MKIIVVGGTGLIGRHVVELLSAGNTVVAVGSTTGEHRVDLTSQDAIRKMYKAVGRFDALVSTAGIGITLWGGLFDEGTLGNLGAALERELDVWDERPSLP